MPAKVTASRGPPGGLRQVSGAVVAVHIRALDGDCRNRAHGAALNAFFAGEDRYCAMEPGRLCLWCVRERERGKGAVVRRHVRQRRGNQETRKRAFEGARQARISKKNVP